MWNSVVIAGRTCHIYQKGNSGPVFLWAFHVHGEGTANEALTALSDELESQLSALKVPANSHDCTTSASPAETSDPAGFMIAAYEIADWNAELSPWPAPAAFGTDSFSGNGTETLTWLTESLVPTLRAAYPDYGRYFPMGYSLAGLFSLWALYEADCFSGAVCCSGSLWIDGWDTYAETHRLRTDASVYLSLGGKEEKTRNQKMAAVGDRTRRHAAILKDDSRAIRSTLEWNPGGHFADHEKRLCKGILWTLR